MPLTVAIVFGLIERGVMKCSIQGARNIIQNKDKIDEKTLERKAEKCVEN